MQDLLINLCNNFIQDEESDSENEGSDVDINEDSANQFSKAVNMCDKLLDNKDYLLNISATKSNNPNVAVSLSDNSVEVYNLEKDFEKYTSIGDKSDRVVDLKFCEENNDLLWYGTYNGTISLWDVRTPNKAVSIFTDTTDDKTDRDRKFNSFDISSNRRLLCAGTDVFEGDSFLLFWDIRNPRLAGGFWESHTDDITQVKFHPSDPYKMLSGSTDGLINIYDLTQTTEEDSLIDCLNTESTIEKLSWTVFGSGDIISCTTHVGEVQMWKSEDVQPYCNFSRADLAHSLQRTSECYIYVVDVHVTKTNALVLAGSNVKNGECARILKLENSTLEPAFGLFENRQRIRCSWFNENINLLLTGGEKGYLNAWKLS